MITPYVVFGALLLIAFAAVKDLPGSPVMPSKPHGIFMV
jgi:hypothetical protein